MDRGRAGALLALAACIACSAAAPTLSDQTALDTYEGATEGCYYNFQHYGEGDRIMTNEPCLNCTCHNRMLMCYLRVCPFTKAIGQDCTLEKRADQCCPIVTCPDVPVDLLTSTSTSSPAEYGGTGVGKVDNYGCTINGKYFPEGSKVPPTPNKPCEHCYCIRNMTTCVMQECTLHVDGCTPIYHKDVCCPVRYFCDHPEDMTPLLLDDMTTTVRPTPGFLLTTTDAPVTETTAKRECVENGQLYPDGALIKTEKPCVHCYCMKGDIVCVVQECGTPMENEGKNCTSQPPREGQCCPDTYICEGDEVTIEPATDLPFQDVTTLQPPRRESVEGSGYRNEDDELPYTALPTFMTEEGSGEEEATGKPAASTAKVPLESDLESKFGTTESDENVPLTTHKPEIDDKATTEPDKGLNTVPSDEEDITEASLQVSTIGEEITKPAESQKTTHEAEPAYEFTDKNILRDRTTSSSELEKTSTVPTFTELTTPREEVTTTSKPVVIEDKQPTSPQISEFDTEASTVEQTTPADDVKLTSRVSTVSSEEEDVSESSSELPATSKFEVTESKSEEDVELTKTSPRFDSETTQPSVASEEYTVPQEVQTEEPSTDKIKQPVEPYTSAPIESQTTSKLEDQPTILPSDAHTTSKYEGEPTVSPFVVQTTSKSEELPTESSSDAQTTSKDEEQPTLSSFDVHSTSESEDQPTVSPSDTQTTSKYEELPTESPIDTQTTSKYDEKPTESPTDTQTTSKYDEKPTESPTDTQTTSKYEEKSTVSSIDAQTTSKSEEQPTVSSIDAQTTSKYEEQPTLSPIESQTTSKYEEIPTLSPFDAKTTSKFEEIPTLLPTDIQTTSKYEEQPTESPIDTQTTSKYEDQPTGLPIDSQTSSKSEEQPTVSPIEAQTTSKYDEQPTMSPIDAQTTSKSEEQPTVSSIEPQTTSEHGEQPSVSPADAQATSKYEEQSTVSPIDSQTTSKSEEQSSVSPVDLKTTSKYEEQPTVSPIEDKDKPTTESSFDSKLTTVLETKEDEIITTESTLKQDVEKITDADIEKPTTSSDVLKETTTTPEQITKESEVQPTTAQTSGHDDDVTKEPDTSLTGISPEVALSTEPAPTAYEEETKPTTSGIKYEVPETTTVNPELNEIGEDHSPILPPGRIPGEGDCLLDGVTYSNESVVPPSSKCHSSCKCVSSIIKCDEIICSPQPEYMDDCQLIYDTPDSCCPTYVCDHPRETIPPEPHSHMSVTESPITKIDCEGDQCEISKDKLPTSTESGPEKIDMHCTSEGCGVDAQLPEKIDIPSIQPEECSGDGCQPTETCTGDNCKSIPDTPISDTKPPIKSCDGDSCVSHTETPAIITPLCENGPCQDVPGENKPIVTPQEVPKECTSEDECKQTKIPEISVIPCVGDSCSTVESTSVQPECSGSDCQPSDTTIEEACAGDSCRRDQTTQLDKQTTEKVTFTESYEDDTPRIKPVESTTKQDDSEVKLPEEQESTTTVPQQHPTMESETENTAAIKPDKFTESPEYSSESTTESKAQEKLTEKIPESTEAGLAATSEQSPKDVTESIPVTEISDQSTTLASIEKTESVSTQEYASTEASKVPEIERTEYDLPTETSRVTDMDVELKPTEHSESEQPAKTTTLEPEKEDDLQTQSPIEPLDLTTKSPSKESEEYTTPESPKEQKPDESVTTESDTRVTESQSESLETQSPEESTTSKSVITESTTIPSHDESQGEYTSMQPYDQSKETTKSPTISEPAVHTLSSLPETQESETTLPSVDVRTTELPEIGKIPFTESETSQHATDHTPVESELPTSEPSSKDDEKSTTVEEKLEQQTESTVFSTEPDIQEPEILTRKPIEEEPLDSDATTPPTDILEYSTEITKPEVPSGIPQVTESSLETEATPKDTGVEDDIATKIPPHPEATSTKQPSVTEPSESQVIGEKDEEPIDTESPLVPIQPDTSTDKLETVTEKISDFEQPQSTDKPIPTDQPKLTDTPFTSPIESTTTAEETEKSSTAPAESYTAAPGDKPQGDIKTTQSPIENEIVDHTELTIKPSLETDAPAIITKDKEPDTDIDFETTEGSGFEATTLADETPKVTEPPKIEAERFTTEAPISEEDLKPHKPEDEFTSQTPSDTTQAVLTDKETESYAQPTTEQSDLATKGIHELEPTEQSDREDEKDQKPTEPSVTEETIRPEVISKLPEEPVPTSGPQLDHTETTPYIVELEEHTHKIDEEHTTSPSEEPTTRRSESEEPVSEDQETGDQESTVTVLYDTTSVAEVSPDRSSPSEDEVVTDSVKPESTTETADVSISEDKEKTTAEPTVDDEKHTTFAPSQPATKQPEEETAATTSKPVLSDVTLETTAPQEDYTPTKSSTEKAEEEQTTTQSSVLLDKYTKPEEKPAEQATMPSTDAQKPAIEESQQTEETPTDEDSPFPPSGGYGQEPDYGDEDQAFGPGTCRYGGKVYVSAQQIPRDDPCDFCFCFRSDIICLQQSCPPPIHGCHEEPIQGFCCPRYECPVSMATSLNVTTTTTTTTTTLPPHFLPHAYKGAALRKGCQIKGHTYKVGEVVRSSSGPCLHCTCGGDGQMKCDPKVCTPEPMLRQMIAAAVSAKRRR